MYFFFHYIMKMKQVLFGLKLGGIPENYQRIAPSSLDVVMAPNLNSFKSRLNVHYKNFPLKFCPSFMSTR